VGPILTPDEVIDFVLKRRQFPRSIVHCLDSIEETVAQLQAPDGMLRSLRQTLRPIVQHHADVEAPGKLHRLIDNFQIGLADLDAGIQELWFALPPS
jgi:uncharacterized alpha-E superfamily protein